jgi:hypothetical protein
MRKPSKKVRNLFASVETLALQLEDLTLEEERLQQTLDEIWRRKACVMANLAAAAQDATLTEVAEATGQRKGA